MAKNSLPSSKDAVIGKTEKTGEVPESKAAATPAATKAAAKAPASPAEPKPAAKPVESPVVTQTAETPPAAKTAPKPQAKAPAKSAKSDEAKPKTAPKRTATRKAKGASAPAGEPGAVEIDAWIKEAAYYLAEKRNFAPGYEAEDWELARAQVLARLVESKAKG